MVGKMDYSECSPRVSMEQMPGMNYERKIS